MIILRLDRTGDFGAAALQRLRQRRDLPVAFADILGFRRKSGISPASIRAWRSTLAASNCWRRGSKARCSLATRARASGQDFVETGMHRGVDLHASGQVQAHGLLLTIVVRWKTGERPPRSEDDAIRS